MCSRWGNESVVQADVLAPGQSSVQLDILHFTNHSQKKINLVKKRTTPKNGQVCPNKLKLNGPRSKTLESRYFLWPLGLTTPRKKLAASGQKTAPNSKHHVTKFKNQIGWEHLRVRGKCGNNSFGSWLSPHQFALRQTTNSKLLNLLKFTTPSLLLQHAWVSFYPHRPGWCPNR
jgi:hypothetical protein